jgi:hypothetical protein
MVGYGHITYATAADDDIGVDLVAVARSGVRPDECGGGSRLRPTRWERAKTPGLRVYCDALARGYAALSTEPNVASRSAQLAEAALPGHAAPLVLSARAEFGRGELSAAFGHFERALSLSRASLDSPATLHAFASCAVETGHVASALTAYRALVPRADLFGEKREELASFVEAAVLVMSQGKDSLAEAIGYLTEARRKATLPGIGDTVLAALALALSRAGRSAEASSVVEEVSGLTWLEGERTARLNGKPSGLPTLPSSEIDAMIAIVAERSDRSLAIERWQSYLATDAGKSGPFAAHARAHRDALTQGRGGP